MFADGLGLCQDVQEVSGRQCAFLPPRKQAEEEREKLIIELQIALSEIKTLRGLLPICMNCHKIRTEHGAWNKLETYISKHSDAEFSHGICPDCFDKQMKEIE